MASRRHLKARECGTKIPYPTKEDAEHARHFLSRRQKYFTCYISVYKCRFGKHWHIGRRRGTYVSASSSGTS